MKLVFIIEQSQALNKPLDKWNECHYLSVCEKTGYSEISCYLFSPDALPIQGNDCREINTKRIFFGEQWETLNHG